MQLTRLYQVEEEFDYQSVETFPDFLRTPPAPRTLSTLFALSFFPPGGAPRKESGYNSSVFLRGFAPGCPGGPGKEGKWLTLGSVTGWAGAGGVSGRELQGNCLTPWTSRHFVL